MVVRINSIARDTLLNYIYLIDEAVEKAVLTDEPKETNYSKKYFLDYLKRLVKRGIGFKELRSS
jgi:hydrogenobyrinic acid a,c-diamide cobaltochelatase (EC 6.6.1.2)/cobaltochelatase CobN subunit (EC 6.6.1.2)